MDAIDVTRIAVDLHQRSRDEQWQVEALRKSGSRTGPDIPVEPAALVQRDRRPGRNSLGPTRATRSTIISFIRA